MGPWQGRCFPDIERLTSGRFCTSLCPLLQAGVQADGGTPGGMDGGTPGGKPFMERELDIQMVVFKCFIFGTIKT